MAVVLLAAAWLAVPDVGCPGAAWCVDPLAIHAVGDGVEGLESPADGCPGPICADATAPARVFSLRLVATSRPAAPAERPRPGVRPLPDHPPRVSR